MTLYAHTTDGTIDQVGALPALWLGPTRWHDWRGDPETWATQPADWGWQPVVETPRPADTATHTSDPAPVALVAGVPTQQWTVRPWTAEELAARAEQAARFDSIDARLARIEAHLWPPVDPDAEVPATVPTMADYAGIWPAGQLLSDGGKVWRNATTVPLTTAPSGFPGAPSQWTRLFVEVSGGTEPEPSEWPAWKPWDNQPTSLYAKDAKVSHNGRRWVANVGNNHWEPGVYGWTDAGPS